MQIINKPKTYDQLLFSRVIYLIVFLERGRRRREVGYKKKRSYMSICAYCLRTPEEKKQKSNPTNQSFCFFPETGAPGTPSMYPKNFGRHQLDQKHTIKIIKFFKNQ